MICQLEFGILELIFNLIKLYLNLLLFFSGDADFFDILCIFDWVTRVDIGQLRVYVTLRVWDRLLQGFALRDLHQTLPVAILYTRLSHTSKEWQHCVEVVDNLIQLDVCWPVFHLFWQTHLFVLEVWNDCRLYIIKV